MKSGRAVRGASTISEQVVGMLHPRPRSVWSRWLEGLRGARARAAFHEARDPRVLSEPGAVRGESPRRASGRELLLRARSRDAQQEGDAGARGARARADAVRPETRSSAASAGAIERLAAALTRARRAAARGTRRRARRAACCSTRRSSPWPRRISSSMRAPSGSRRRAPSQAKLATTLDAGLQAKVQRMLDERMDFLGTQPRGARGRARRRSRRRARSLAWVVAGGGGEEGPKSSHRRRDHAAAAGLRPEAVPLRARARPRLDGGEDHRRRAARVNRPRAACTATRTTAGGSTAKWRCATRSATR